ncbi:DEAD/DEAH box helicase [Hydrogenothermus marinus]|uniref:Helicase-like protein n=1 Tax=Hydrogenothermus marinus TaxID=133270 RepID=A0A3M0B722_9AQUI|nr:DEAD/DEAH box helicase [Hydrogenothermus marinus]RMA93210.1 helicase-like protein [Hydrogenothermus marinus]
MITLIEEYNVKDLNKEDTVVFFNNTVEISENLVKKIDKYQIFGKVFKQNEGFNLKDLKEKENNKIKKSSVKNISIFDLLIPVLNPEINFDIPQEISFPYKLYNYQVYGVKFLLSNKSALLADQMGTGKTVQSTTAIRILFIKGLIKKALIVAPSSLLSVWEQHIKLWAPELQYILINEKRDIRKILFNTKAHVYIISYDTLKNDYKNEKEILDKFSTDLDLVLLDEAHNIKNPDALKTKAVLFVSRFSKYRWALTGTPIQNNLKEFLSLYKFLFPDKDLPKDLTEEEASALIKPIMLRRLKKDVLKDLPDKMPPIIEKLSLSPSQRQEYEHILGIEQEKISNLIDKHKDSKKFKFILKQNLIHSIQRLRQICNFPSSSLESPKMERLKEIVLELIENKEKVVIFTNFYKYGIERIAKSLSNEIGKDAIALFYGNMSQKERKKSIRKFKEDENCFVFLGTVGSAGEGLTLTEASYAIFFDMHWNPAKMWQAEDRIHRIGQKNKVIIHTLITKDTIEENILKKVEEKKKLINNVVDGVKHKITEEDISIDSLLEIIGLGKS